MIYTNYYYYFYSSFKYHMCKPSSGHERRRDGLHVVGVLGAVVVVEGAAGLEVHEVTGRFIAQRFTA